MLKRKILVTGGAGNVGSALACALASDSRNYVVIVDNLLTGSTDKLPLEHPRDNWSFVRADVNRFEDLMPIFAANRFEYVFHYAAVVGVRRTLDNPLSVLRDIDGFRHLLNLCKSFGVKRIFFSSSSEVYGEPVEIPQVEETTPLNSRLPYSVVKNVGEVYLKTYQREFGLPYTIFRFFNTYGPRQTADFVISRFIEQALLDQPLTIYGDGKQTRTFCYVDDNVQTAIKALEGNLAVNDTINVGSDEEMTILDLAHRIKALLSSSSPIVHLPALSEGDMRRRCPDTSKMRAIIGRPLIDLDTGILRTAEALKSRSL